MNSLFTDHFSKPSGELSFDVFHRGDLIEHFCEKNLIVDTSKTIHAHLLGGSVTGKSVTKIGFGTNGTAPVGGNAALTGVFSKNIALASYPLSNNVKFDFTLDSAENNGMSIMEFGLLTTDGSLYARKVRGSALVKTIDISIVGSWIITF